MLLDGGNTKYGVLNPKYRFYISMNFKIQAESTHENRNKATSNYPSQPKSKFFMDPVKPSLIPIFLLRI
jgi:hypothetical protein